MMNLISAQNSYILKTMAESQFREICPKLFFLVLLFILESFCLENCKLDANSVYKKPVQSWQENRNGDIGPDNSYFPSFVFRDVPSYNTYQCFMACYKDTRCKSYNYGVNKCELNLSDRESQERSSADSASWVEHDGKWVKKENGLISLNGYKYYSRDAFISLKNPSVRCLPNSCKTNEQCSPDPFSSQAIVCQKKEFSPKDFFVDWTQWGQWSPCTVTCGQGSQQRTRSCSSAKRAWMCRGGNIEYQLCSTAECPVWSAWGSWSSCRATRNCGSGLKNRTRVCQTEVPQHANLCVGNKTQAVDCNLPSCTVPIRLSNKTHGYVSIYDNSNMYKPKWRHVCQGEAASEDGFLMLRKQTRKAVCRNLGLYFVGVENNIEKTTTEGYFKPTSCNENLHYPMLCEHEEWKLQPPCIHLYTTCTEIKLYNKPANMITWNLVDGYCKAEGRRICSYEEIFPDASTNSYTPLVSGVLPGDHWAPVSNEENEWAQIGDDNNRTGWIYSQHFGFPYWGSTKVVYNFKGNYFCCR